MSEKRLNDELTNPELLDLEASLRGLSAVGNLNRDELLFEAGRRSAYGRSDSRSRIWKNVSMALALMLVGQSFLFWTGNNQQITDKGSAQPPPVTPEADAPIRESDSPYEPMADNTKPAVHVNVPAQRPEFLELRRVALTRGVDAAFSSHADDANHSVIGQPTQQELLRELLGS